jgi:hypothetical protein
MVYTKSPFSRDILLPMNYRRGFQRLYLVLSVAWMVVACLAYRWSNQPRSDAGDRFTRNAASQSLSGGGGDEFDQYLVKTAPPPNSEAPNGIRRYAKGVSIAFIPPLFGYLILFQVVPWIWRGFKPCAPA